MSDITDIVSRLRRTDENRGVPICSEAADTIERLRKERDALFVLTDRLTVERNEAMDEVSLLRSTVTDLNIEIERLRKERDETTASLDALLLIQGAQAHGFDCCKEDE